MKHWFSFGLLLGALISPARLGAQSPGNQAVGLSAGDVIRIAVWRQPELSGEFQIAMEGTIVHPLYQGVRVAGVPFADVRTRIGEILAEYESNPQFVIEPLLRVAVAGEVRNPNLYMVAPATTIAQAVALAGGATAAAKLESARLLRGGQELAVDLTQPQTGVATYAVHSGDQIVLDRRGSFVRDVLTPLASVTAAIAALVNIVLK